MAQVVIWSPAATQDLRAITEYIASDSPFYAQAVAQRLLKMAADIPQFPHLGRIVPEWREESLRERFVYSYRLIYRLGDSQIIIVAIVHGRRLLEPYSDRIQESDNE